MQADLYLRLVCTVIVYNINCKIKRRKNTDMIKAVLTVIGKDRVGIIAAVSNYLASVNVNILDISQTIMDEIFTMVMLVDVAGASEQFGTVADRIKTMGSDMGLQMQLQHVDIFNSMHKI